MPSLGVLIIVFGGLLSTMSALNATVMASSRVAFSMGRERMLPESLAIIHPLRRTPHVAVLVTGAILVAFVDRPKAQPTSEGGSTPQGRTADSCCVPDCRQLSGAGSYQRPRRSVNGEKMECGDAVDARILPQIPRENRVALLQTQARGLMIIFYGAWI